jgi:hypothetical protein
MAVEDKSLPSLPGTGRLHVATYGPTRLSVESHAHRRAFLQYMLEEEGLKEVYNESHSDEEEGHSWVGEMERALDELGECIASGGWLAGFRRARATLKRHFDNEKKPSSIRPTAVDGKVKPEATVGNPSDVEKDSTAGSSNGTGTPQVDTEMLKDTSLKQLGEILTRHKPQTPATPKPTIKHLLLTVAPAVPAPDAEPLVRHTSLSCSFQPGFFLTLSNGRLGGLVLYGLDEWDCEYRLSLVKHS